MNAREKALEEALRAIVADGRVYGHTDAQARVALAMPTVAPALSGYVEVDAVVKAIDARWESVPLSVYAIESSGQRGFMDGLREAQKIVRKLLADARRGTAQ